MESFEGTNVLRQTDETEHKTSFPRPSFSPVFMWVQKHGQSLGLELCLLIKQGTQDVFSLTCFILYLPRFMYMHNEMNTLESC